MRKIIGGGGGIAYVSYWFQAVGVDIFYYFTILTAILEKTYFLFTFYSWSNYYNKQKTCTAFTSKFRSNVFIVS